ALREQRIEERDAAAEHVGKDREPELEREKRDDRIELSAREPRLERVARRRVLRDADDGVDDEGADVERRDGQERADEAQGDERDADRRARLPHQLQERRKIAQRPHALAHRSRHGSADAAGALRRHSPSHRILSWHPFCPRTSYARTSEARARAVGRRARRRARTFRVTSAVTLADLSDSRGGMPEVVAELAKLPGARRDRKLAAKVVDDPALHALDVVGAFD